MIFLFYKNQLNENLAHYNARLFQIIAEIIPVSDEPRTTMVLVKGKDVVNLFKKIMLSKGKNADTAILKTICWYNPFSGTEEYMLGTETVFEPANITLYAKEFQEQDTRYLLKLGAYVEEEKE